MSLKLWFDLIVALIEKILFFIWKLFNLRQSTLSILHRHPSWLLNLFFLAWVVCITFRISMLSKRISTNRVISAACLTIFSLLKISTVEVLLLKTQVICELVSEALWWAISIPLCFYFRFYLFDSFADTCLNWDRLWLESCTRIVRVAVGGKRRAAWLVRIHGETQYQSLAVRNIFVIVGTIIVLVTVYFSSILLNFRNKNRIILDYGRYLLVLVSTLHHLSC